MPIDLVAGGLIRVNAANPEACDAFRSQMLEHAMPELNPELTLNPDTAFYIALKAREYGAKVEDTDPDEGSNPIDDNDVDVLESSPDDAVEEELRAAIDPLNEDEKLDLIALAWIGRGDFGFDEWAEARESAREVDLNQASRYLIEMPALSDYLESALSELGHSLDDYLDSHLISPVAPELGTPPS